MDVFDRDRPGGLTDRYVAFTPSSTTDRAAVSIRNMARNVRGVGLVEAVPNDELNAMMDAAAMDQRRGGR